MNSQGLTPDQIAHLSNSRVRMQRLKDAKLFSGWIDRISPLGVFVRIDKCDELEPGDKFFLQAYGDSFCAMMPTTLSLTRDGMATFSVDGPIKPVASNEEMRTLLDGELKVLVKLGWFEVWGRAIDLSFSGIGLMTNAPADKGEMADVSILTDLGEVKGRCEIRYCRPWEGSPGTYRVGILLEEFDRLNMAKWRQYLKSIGAAIDDAA